MDKNKIQQMYEKLERGAKNLFGENTILSEYKKSQPYLDKSYSDKRRILREYSIKEEISEYISYLTDDCVKSSPEPVIGYDNGQNTDKIKEIFYKIINTLGFNNTNILWQTIKDFIIDGYIVYEIIWDDKKKNIIGFNRLRPDSLVPAYEKEIGNYWIQYPTDSKLKRMLLDSQIIFISYSSEYDFSETSYVERLIKPYNHIKILEQTMIMWNITNATLYQKFTIPVKGLSKQKAEAEIGQLIENYSDHVEWDDTLGELKINGSKNIPFQKQYWFPDSDQGTPGVSNIQSPTNLQPNHLETIEYFKEQLRKAAKFPEKGNEREELRYKNFVKKIQDTCKEIIIKPMKLQLFNESVDLDKIDININF